MNASFRLSLFAAVFLLFASCVPAQISVGVLPANVKCIAVAPFEIRFEATAQNEMLSEFLALELSQKNISGILGPLDMARLFREANDPLPPLIDPYWARQIGTKVGADAVLFGSLTRFPILRGGREGQESVLINVDAYLIEAKTGVIVWTYGFKDEVLADNAAFLLADEASNMVHSMLRKKGLQIFQSDKNCWHAPTPTLVEMPKASAKVAALPTPTPSPTPLPPPPLTNTQKKILADIGKPGGYGLPASTFKERSIQFSKAGIVKLRDLASSLLDVTAPPTLEIQGHIDGTENEADDLELSRQRAQAIKRYLVDLGIDSERLHAIGFGGTKPLFPNLSAKSRMLNRRTDVVPLSGKRP